MSETLEHSPMLKPCPFCGGKAEFERMGTIRQSCIVECADCGCRLESNETGSYGTRWNKRHPQHICQELESLSKSIQFGPHTAEAIRKQLYDLTALEWAVEEVQMSSEAELRISLPTIIYLEFPGGFR